MRIFNTIMALHYLSACYLYYIYYCRARHPAVFRTIWHSCGRCHHERQSHRQEQRICFRDVQGKF